MNKTLSLLIFIFLFIGCDRKFIDMKQDKFIPSDLQTTFNSLNDFDIGHWNHIVVNSEHDFCNEMKLKFSDSITKMMCHLSLSDHQNELFDYLDVSFVLKRPPSNYKNKLNKNLSLLSMPLGQDSELLLKILRRDPFDIKSDLMNKMKSFNFNGFEWTNGYLKDSVSVRKIIPIQFNYNADNINKTKNIIKYLKEKKAHLIGRHYDFYINQTQIQSDVNVITSVSVILFLLAFGFLYKNKHLKVLVSLVPSVIATLVSFIILSLTKGPLHGLTLSFGFGIIGLGMDYGIHFLFSKDRKNAFISNIFGLITTLSVFFVFSFSSIPIIEEMMMFSMIGIVVSFILSHIILNRFKVSHYLNFSTVGSEKHLVIFYIAIMCIPLLGLNQYDFNMRRFNYTPTEHKEIQNWFYEKWGERKLYFKIYKSDEIGKIQSDYLELTKNYPEGESLFKHIPSLDLMKENVGLWRKFFNETTFTNQEKLLYKPFLDQWKVISSTQDLLPSVLKKKFLSHLQGDNKYINLWFVDRKQDALSPFLLEKSHSIENILNKASKNIFNELKTFVIITFTIITLILFIRYRSIKKALICLTPFLFSLGLFFLVNLVLGTPITFMTLMGLLLLYGISVDYGIFTTDHYLNEGAKDFKELNTSLLFSWASSFIGFVPLILCRHNVLHDLALAVVVGLVGTILCTFYIVPQFARRLRL
jgi:hypothetical protein